jgi:Spy/CpxP family protein refolding chaperone
MKRISSLFILIFLILFIASQLSYAEHKPPIDNMEREFQQDGYFSETPPMMPCDMEQMNGMPWMRHLPGMHLERINLDEKQKGTFKEIENSATKELIRKGADEAIAEIELQELLEKDTVDLKAVEAKLKQIAAIKTETQLLVIKSMEKMKAKLTLKQREMLKDRRPIDHPLMEPPMMGEMMRDETIMPPPSFGERG